MINSFQGEYGWLSNFWMAPIHVKGKIWLSVEHAFQVCKTLDVERHEQIRQCKTPAQAKRIGIKVLLRKDWDLVKDRVMKHLLLCKFSQHPELRDKLLNTSTETLVEGNNWHDNYWGSCTCNKCKNRGKNKLGELLMSVRKILEIGKQGE
jgi:ribA/ribD-fused uncharacterized protein